MKKNILLLKDLLELQKLKSINTKISKNLYIDELDNIVNKYNNTYHRAIQTKPVDIE